MRRLFNRGAAFALCVSVALGAAAAPCAASDAATTKGTQLTKLSPASRQVLVTTARAGLASPAASAKLRGSEGGQAQGTPTASGPFFKSTRGKVTLALMGAGVGFTIWSINHDRKPVKSPVR